MKRIPYGHQWLDESDRKAVDEVLRSDFLTTGPRVAEFEEALAGYCGAKYAVVCSSGTAALHLACMAMGWGKCEVLVPTLTFAATANAVIYCGGTPVFTDIDPDTLNMNMKELDDFAFSIPVDMAGLPCRIEPDHIVIEDACHALGADVDGHKVGWGDHPTCFSLHPVKGITSGEGGVITTDDEGMAKDMRLMRSHSTEKLIPGQPTWYYEINGIGFNYRMTDFQAALGLSQLKRRDSFIARRREIANRYTRAFSQIPEIITPPSSEGHAWHIYIIQLKTLDRERVFTALQEHGLDPNVHYFPLHLQPYYQRKYGYKKGDFPIAEWYAKRCITLPIFPAMTDEIVQKVINVVEKVVTSGE